MATNQQKYMVDHLRDMFNGSFDDEIIESILIQREWNVDRALDDLMALTSGCNFSIPIDDFDNNGQNQAPELSEFVNNGFEGACSDLVESENFYPVEDYTPTFGSEEGNDDDMKNESEDDVIVLNQEEYCLSAGSESEEETPVAAPTTEVNSPLPTTQPDNADHKLSYAAAAKPVAPTTELVSRVKPPYIVYQGYTSYDQIKRTRDSLERIKLFVAEGFKIMVLLRGCPGSGKSYLARKIIKECGIENNYYQHVHSTDNYFHLNGSGEYLLNLKELQEAHGWNVANVLHVAREGLTPIVIDNTNTKMWEMSKYAKIAVCAGYEIEVMEPDTPWAFNVKELLSRCHHNVPSKGMMNYLDRYEHNVSALSLIKTFNLEYASDKVPPKLGVRRLTNPKLVDVFENIYHVVHVMANQSAQAKSSKKKLTKVEKKKLYKAEKKLAKAEKKQRKREKRLKKMIEQVRHEDSESDDDDDDDDGSNDSCIRDGAAETVEAFLSTDLREKGTDLELEADDDVTSENSWTTIDTHDDYDDNSSDDERESNSVDDHEEKDSSSSSSSLSDEAQSVTRDNQSTRNDSDKGVEKSSGSKKKARKAPDDFENVDSMIDDMKNSECTEMTLESEGTSKREFSCQLYDALAKNRPRLKFFENLRTEDESSSEPSKDSTFENISRKLDELDIESEELVGSHQTTDDLETSGDLLVESGDLLVDLNLRNSTSTPTADDEVLHFVEEGEIVRTKAANDELLADLVECTSDSVQNDDSSSNLEVQLTDRTTGTENNPPKCEWIGLENCVNLPSNVKIEKSIEVSEVLPAGVENSTENVCILVEEHKDQNLKIRDVIPSCLMNEVVESSADVPLDDQLKETISTPTAKTWSLDWWHRDYINASVPPLEQSTKTDFSVATENDDSGCLLSSVKGIDEAILDVGMEEINLTIANINKPSNEIVDTLENVEEMPFISKEETNSPLTTASDISGNASAEVERIADVTLEEVLEEVNPKLEVENELLDCSLADSKNVDEVAPINQRKGTSLTSAIKNWLSSNPFNEVKNNTGVSPFNEQSKDTSFSSAIKNWVSGNSRNEVKSNEDVPDGASLATNSTPPVAAFENQCKQTSSPAPKNLAEDSPSKQKSPIRCIRKKLCNVETEICNEADILQTMLRQEMQKKRNDNGVNVDDVNVANKFDRDAEGGVSAGTNVVKNIFDGPYEDVNLFGEWNQVEKNPMEHLAVENEADSENSDGGSNSSSSDEIRTITDVHNSVTRFVNNDINRDAGVERKKPNVNHEACNRQLKNKNMSASTPADAESELCWSPDSNAPELNTLKELILIKSLDKVFSQNNVELDAVAAAPADSVADVKQTKKSTLSCAFQMIENKLHTETSGNEEATAKIENEASVDEKEVSFWNQWIRGENWDEKPTAPEAASSDTMESKPPRKVRDSPTSPAAKSNIKNSDPSSCWLVNDIKSCMDMEKNHQKLPKTSNFLSSGDPFLQAKELREFVDDHKVPASVKLQNRSPIYDFLEERTDESKNLQRLSSEFSDVFLSGKRKRSDAFAESSVSPTKWDHPSNGEPKNFSLTDSMLRMSPSRKQQQRESPTAFTVGKAVNDRNVDELSSRWKFNSPIDDSRTSNYWPKSASKILPALENDFSLDNGKFERKQKPSEFGNFFIPPEVLHLGQNKATNTGVSDVNGYDRYLVSCGREINGCGNDANEDDLSPIEVRYNSDKSTMTDANAYTVKAKPQREDLSNMFPHEMADAILDLYEKCNGNMDWIIEILMEDGYSPSDDQLEYLSSLQNVVEYRQPADTNPIKEKLSFEKKKNRSRNRNRKNESRQNVLKSKRVGNVNSKTNVSPDNMPKDNLKTNVSPDNMPKDFVSTSEQCISSAKENDQEHLLGSTMYEDTFDDSTECVDLFIDWTTVSQLIKYFGNPTVYPIHDYQPVIKLPVSLARHLHAHLIESVIDQAEKNEILMNQLNFEMNAAPAVENELTQTDLADVESSFPDYLVDDMITSRFVEENGVFCCTHEAEPVIRSEDSFAATFSLNLLRKAFPTMDSSFVKDTFRSQNFNYFKTKEILSQYKDEVPVVNLKEVPPVGAAEVELDEDHLKHDEIRLFDSSVIKSSSREEILAQVRKFREDATTNFAQWKRCHEKLKSALRDKSFGVASHCRETMEEFKRKYERCNAQAASLLVTSCSQNDNIIDLHFFKVVEALRALDIFLDHHITKLAASGRQKAELYIITGRGSRSVDGVSHLQPPIKQRLKQRNIEFCIESTNTGLVKAVIRKTSLLSQDL